MLPRGSIFFPLRVTQMRIENTCTCKIKDHYNQETANDKLRECQSCNVRKKVKIRNRYNQAPHQIQDNTWESDKNTIKKNIQESQEVSPFQPPNFDAGNIKYFTTHVLTQY